MAELATIARPYADALFKASAADLAGTAAWLEPVAVVAANSQLQQYAASPAAVNAKVLELVSSVAKVALPQAAQNFLNLVLENGRLAVLPEIAVQFRALQNAKNSCADAVVFSAFALDQAAVSDLSLTLEKRFARKLNLNVEVDPSLIGGVRVVVGDEVLDASVGGRCGRTGGAGGLSPDRCTGGRAGTGL